MQRIFYLLSVVTLLIALVALFKLTSASSVSTVKAQSSPPPSQTRDVRFRYHAEIPSIDHAAKRLDIWIPLPRQDAYQSASGVAIESNLEHEVVALPRFENRTVHFYAAAPLPASASMTVEFGVKRRQQAADMALAARPLAEPTGGEFAPLLGPDRMIPLNGAIARVADGLRWPGAGALEQARAIYQYVTRTMTYVHSGKGVGHGDAVFACDLHHGNCTDFHSLFIALARARGIPARFIIGLPLGGQPSGTIPGYHCWAEFYAGGVWVPVDASKAVQMPARHAYYFGQLDADRVAFTIGRDLELVPRQHGGPLNYFIYPYAELDGRALPAAAINMKFTYRDITAAGGQES